jgi:antitoxin (DNA-binding transcriptional repressor) of toxin-antitoxin stability system
MQVSIRELKANPAGAIAQVQQGVRVQITSHRKVVAELVMPGTAAGAAAVSSDAEAMQKLLASGLAEPASKPFKLGKPVAFPSGPKGQTMSDLVIALRGPQ